MFTATYRDRTVCSYRDGRDMVWRCFSQVREATDDQDNETPQMAMRRAAAFERWAASRADCPAFAQMCYVAVAEAAAVRRQYRPRAV